MVTIVSGETAGPQVRDRSGRPKRGPHRKGPYGRPAAMSLAPVLGGYLLRENTGVSDAIGSTFEHQLDVSAVVAPTGAVALVGC